MSWKKDVSFAGASPSPIEEFPSSSETLRESRQKTQAWMLSWAGSYSSAAGSVQTSIMYRIITPLALFMESRVWLDSQVEQAALQEPSFRSLLREFERPLEGAPSFRIHSQAAAQVGSSRVGRMVVLQVPALEYPVYEFEADRGAVPHREGHRAVERHHGRRVHVRKEVVVGDYSAPVGRRCALRLGVHGGDGGLDGIGPRVSRGQGPLRQARTLCDQFQSSISPNSPKASPSGRSSLNSRPKRIASAESSSRLRASPAEAKYPSLNTR